MAGLDMDYCMIVIDKIINPLTPKDQLGNLVKWVISFFVRFLVQRKSLLMIHIPQACSWIGLQRAQHEEFGAKDHGPSTKRRAEKVNLNLPRLL